MRIMEITCDRCGEKIMGKPVKVFIDRVERETGDICTEGELIEGAAELRAKDFCADCAMQLIQEVASKAQMKRREIDHGKVFALKKAGWTIKAIAEEIGASEQSIRNVISRAKKKEEEVRTG